MKRAISPQKWLAIARTEAWTENDQRCTYCFAVLSRKSVTADHVEPKSQGGSNERGNIKPACKWCNSSKGAMTVAAFQRLLKAKGPTSLNILYLRAARRINLAAMRAAKRIQECVR